MGRYNVDNVDVNKYELLRLVILLAKTYRTAFIRVSSDNDTSSGEVVYDFDDIKRVLDDWAFSARITYWAIQHSADDEVSLTHFHIVIKFTQPTPFENIKVRFPYGMIESARNIKAAVQYLVHLNDSSKVSYPWESIYTNCKDMTPYKILTNSQQEITIQGVIDAIKAGEIKEYNQFEKIPNELWSKYRTRIENSLLFEREKIYMNKNREIEVWFFSGATGTGKTTFAKHVCNYRGKSYCISSSSNDPFQDYKGEDVLILDDLRDDSFSFVDLLKILDNHTRSTSKSRYHNKAFVGELIIITSTKPLSDWYFSIEKDEKMQLYRRITFQYKFSPDIVNVFEFDGRKGKYVPVGQFENIMATEKKKIDKVKKTLADIGIELTPVSEDYGNKIDKSYDSCDSEEGDNRRRYNGKR